MFHCSYTSTIIFVLIFRKLHISLTQLRRENTNLIICIFLEATNQKNLRLLNWMCRRTRPLLEGWGSNLQTFRVVNVPICDSCFIGYGTKSRRQWNNNNTLTHRREIFCFFISMIYYKSG